MAFLFTKVGLTGADMGESVYSGCKAGVIALSKTLARESMLRAIRPLKVKVIKEKSK